MYTILKIAIVSVLAIFFTVGVVSVSKAEETYFCASNIFFKIDHSGVSEIDRTSKFIIRIKKNILSIKGEEAFWESGEYAIERKNDSGILAIDSSFPSYAVSFQLEKKEIGQYSFYSQRPDRSEGSKGFCTRFD